MSEGSTPGFAVAVTSQKRAMLWAAIPFLVLFSVLDGYVRGDAMPAPKTHLIDEIYLDPPSISLPMDAEMNVVLGRTNAFDLSKLEFRIHQLGPEGWVVVQAWRPWPLPSFRSRFAGRSALQVDVRAPTGEIQREWLGSYFFRNRYERYPTLLRAFMAMEFTHANKSMIVAATLDRLNVAFALLIDSQQPQCLRQCTVAVKDNITRLATPLSDYRWDRKRGTLEEDGTATLLALDQFRQYPELSRRLVDTFGSTTLETTYMAFATQAVHRGHLTGTPPDGFIRSAFEPIAMCNTFSQTLIEILEGLGITTDLVSYANEARGAHAFVRATTDQGTYLLDAMEGRVVAGDLAEAMAGTPMPVVSLPQFQHTGIDFVAELARAKKVYVSDKTPGYRGQAFHKSPTVLSPIQH